MHKNRQTKTAAAWLLTLLITSALGFVIPEPYRTLASTWKPTVFVNTEAFHIIDEGDSTTDVEMRFGDTLNERLYFDRTNSRFQLTDDLFVEGSLSASGTLFLQGTLTGALAFHGPFTSDCDDATNSKLLWDSATGKFSCGTDQTGGSSTWTDGGDVLYPTNGEDVIVGGSSEAAYEVKINTGSRISATFSGGLVVNESGNDNDVRIEGDTDQNLFFLDGSTDKVGIGTADPETKLDIVGSLSGSSLRISGAADVHGAFSSSGSIRTDGNFTINDNADLVDVVLTFGSDVSETLTWADTLDLFVFSDDVEINGSMSGITLTVSSLKGCDTIDTDGNGLFACGTDDGGGGGISQAQGDARYVNQRGDTMTGSLQIRSSSGANAVQLEVTGTMSGRALVVQGTNGSQLLTATGATNRVGIKTTSTNPPETDLDVIGTISGASIHGDRISASGAVSFDSSTSFNNVNYTWPSSTATTAGASASGKVLSVNPSTGQLSWIINRPRIAVATANVSDSATAGTTTVGNLTIPVAASTNYIIRCLLTTNSTTTTTGVQITVNGPSSPTQVTWNRQSCSSTTAMIHANINAFGTEDTRTASAGSTRCVEPIDIHLRNGANAGDVTFSVDTEVTASAVTVYAGSYCDYQSY